MSLQLPSFLYLHSHVLYSIKDIVISRVFSIQTTIYLDTVMNINSETNKSITTTMKCML